MDALCEPDAEYVERRTRELRPDWVLVNDDKLRLLLPSALDAAPADRIVLMLQTITNAPFGPLSIAPSRGQTRRMRRARAIVTISAFLQRYLARYGRLESTVLRAADLRRRPVPVTRASTAVT